MNNPIYIPTDLDGVNQLSNSCSWMLTKERAIWIREITDEIVPEIVAQLIYLSNRSQDDIYLYIFSPGGSVAAGLAIYGVMESISNDIVTVVLGQAASMAAFLAAGGSKGKRYALPHSEYMIHQPLGGAQGQATDIIIHADHIRKIRDKLNVALSQNTGQSIKKVIKDCERDYYMDEYEALKYGLVDHIGLPNITEE